MLVEADSKTIYVDASNVNDPSKDGSSVHPFDLIQEGVDAAGSGDTVQVAAGVYYESVEIKKSSISLVGAKGGTIVDGNGTEPVGIHVYNAPPDYTENVSISGFTVRNCVKGITLSRSINMRLRDNSMVGNTYNFGDYSLQVHDIDTSNTVDGKPIYYWVSQRDKQVPADAGFVALVGSTNMTVRDLDLTNNVQGLLLKNTTHSLIDNVRISDNWDGVYLDRWSNSNTVTGSNISNNLFMGIYVSTSSSNTIANNSILNNAYGLLFDSQVFEGVLGDPGTGNTVRDNVVRGNTVANSSYDGVYLVDSEDNTFYHNNFVNNTRQVYSENSTGKWDDGAEGNYWANYAGSDLNKDGLGDTPHAIGSDDRDNHPLMGLFVDFPAVWEETTYHVTAICDSTLSGFQFSQSDKAISFKVNSPDNASGFCRMSVPTTLLGGPYTLLLDGLPSTDFTERSNGTCSFLYFTYEGVHNVEIEGTSVIPEFPPILLVFLLAAVTAGAAAAVLARKRLAPARSG
jgi:parallel beta-helix repeat protein